MHVPNEFARHVKHVCHPAIKTCLAFPRYVYLKQNVSRQTNHAQFWAEPAAQLLLLHMEAVVLPRIAPSVGYRELAAEASQDEVGKSHQGVALLHITAKAQQKKKRERGRIPAVRLVSQLLQC